MCWNHEEQRIELWIVPYPVGWILSCCQHRDDVDKKEHNESGSGNGGYDAFMSAVKKILKKHHLQCPQLLDYQIRIPRGGQTDALTESIITWDMNGKRVQTVGIDPDQVMQWTQLEDAQPSSHAIGSDQRQKPGESAAWVFLSKFLLHTRYVSKNPPPSLFLLSTGCPLKGLGGGSFPLTADPAGFHHLLLAECALRQIPQLNKWFLSFPMDCIPIQPKGKHTRGRDSSFCFAGHWRVSRILNSAIQLDLPWISEVLCSREKHGKFRLQSFAGNVLCAWPNTWWDLKKGRVSSTTVKNQQIPREANWWSDFNADRDWFVDPYAGWENFFRRRSGSYRRRGIIAGCS